MDAGPFDIKHLIIGGLIIVVTAVAMFMLKGYLSFGFVVPLWMFVIIIITIVVLLAVLILTILSYIRWGPEGFLFAKARKLGLAIFVDVELGSGKADFVLAEKDSPKDVVLKDETSGVKVDPAMLDSYCKPMSFPFGLDIYIFTFYNYMAQSAQNHAAFKEIENIFMSEKYSDLQFLTMKEASELASDPEHYLERNAMIKLNKYFKLTEALDKEGNVIFSNPEKKQAKMTYVRQFMAKREVDGQEVWVEITQDMNLPDLIKRLGEFRRDIFTSKITPGLIAGTEAFKNNSVAYSSQHLAHVLMLYYSKIIEDLKNKIDLLTYGIVGMMLLVGGGVAIYVASLAFKMINGGGGA
jgi:hypothetical protein